MATSRVDGRRERAVLRRAVAVGAVLLAGALDLRNRLGQVAQLRGVALLQDTINKVMGRLNPDLRILGVLATMYDPRTLHSREVLETVTKAFGDQVFSTVIHRTVKFPDAAVAGEPITSFASSSSGAEAYRRLAREVLAR